MQLNDFRPEPKLVAKVTDIGKPRFPVIDAHTHLGMNVESGWSEHPVDELLDVLDEASVEVLVDMDGGWGEEILQARLDKYKSVAPERFCFFGGVDWSMWVKHDNGFGDWAADRLRAQVSLGAEGLKIWKNFGLTVRDQDEKLVPVDDPRLDSLWTTAGELHIPVLIHVADPVAFFDPLDGRNERFEELNAHPDWQFPSPPYPAFQSILDQLFNLVRKHNDTTFIGAHVGCYAENLEFVSHMLESCPNYYVDMAARIGELGRQPYTARKFFIKNSDRILFGTDFIADVDMYCLHYRFLETDDEYFNYGLNPTPTQGRWQVYGLYLPDDVLEKVYRGNARQVLSLE
jgi:predicted TIM-barrel fold metal-dependent hydrolase